METKRCGGYIRVSTGMQARVPEGSLKNQRFALEQFINSRNALDKEAKWEITDYYVDEKTAKDTDRPEYERMISDMRDGRINTILCTALSRIWRSVLDSLPTIDEFRQRNVDFVCLKENFDTSTSFGKCLFTIMSALNAFEREQGAERTRLHMRARADRGLSQGCYILGYDIDRDRPGNLIPSPKEARLVNFLYDTYLKTGSVAATAHIANSNGYVSKVYTSKKTSRLHGGKKFGFSATLNILTSLAYLGKREVNKMNKNKNQDELPEDQRYCVKDAIWKPIVDEKKFYSVQARLKDNFKHKNNGVAPVKHSYTFNGGHLFCEKCGAQMEGRSGRGRGGIYHYYYYCTGSCGHKVTERELELALQNLIQIVASKPLRLKRITDKLNAKIAAQLPDLKEQRRVLTEEINSVGAEAKKIMDEGLLNIGAGRSFVEERLADLEKRRAYLNNRIASLDTEVAVLDKKVVDESKVKGVFGAFDEIFRNKIQPYQRRILLQWVCANVKIGDSDFKLSIDSRGFRSDIRQLFRNDVVLDTSRGSHC